MKTILFVEDQLEFRAIHSVYLERSGYHVIGTGDADDALRLARSEHPALILMDHSLPDRTGVEIARELKSDATTAAIPIVMMSAHPYAAIGRKAREAGCVAVLSKPVEPRRVLQEVRRYAA